MSLAHTHPTELQPRPHDRQPELYLLNRMFIAIATQVGALVEGLFGRPPIEVERARALPTGVIDLLVVGRQSLPAGSRSMSYGFEVLPAALERVEPALIFYVLPGSIDSLHYHADLRVLDQVADSQRVLVVEFSRLQQMGIEGATARAAETLGDHRAGSGEPARLLP